MILLIRTILVFLIIYLLVRSFVRFFAEESDALDSREQKRKEAEAKIKEYRRSGVC
jgi:hypothetical protein